MITLLTRTAPVVLALLASCGSNGASKGSAAVKDRAVIHGTVVVAATGDPATDVRVEGPRGRSTKSDKRGRFELKDFDVGTTGEVTAQDDDGRKARVVLRPLAAGRLEIVLQLARP